MGQAIKASIEHADDLTLAGLWSRGDSLLDVLAEADVAVDFSLPEANAEVQGAVRQRKIPLVCGVSGLDEQQLAGMAELANVVPVVFDRNMSQGIAVLSDIVARVAASLGDEFAIEIHDTHHAKKLDSPSGTALKLAEFAAQGRGVDVAAANIDFKVQRQGEVPGDHTILLSSPTETLRIGHSVTTRQVFVDGALRASRWVLEQNPGLYDMRDVLLRSA